MATSYETETDRTLTPEKLSAVQARRLPRLTWRDVFTLNEGATMTEDEQARLNAYFGQFVALPKNEKGESVCLGCDLPFYKDEGSGLLSALLGGAPHRASWEWGLAHGECRCTKCGWPARAYHFNIGKTDTDDAIITRLNITLAVHADELQAPKESADARR